MNGVICVDRKAKDRFERFRQHLARVVEVGASHDMLSRAYDFWITAIIVVNLAVAVLGTFQEVSSRAGTLLDVIETVTAAFFALDYVLRLIAAKYIYPTPSEGRSLRRYVLSFTGVVDLLSFLPSFLPFFFPEGAVAFRIFRIIRIFRLFRINAYYDSLNAITDVLQRKKQQLLSSVFIILVLMLGSSLCLYSVEHEAQPEVFRNAFSGIWWSVSTLLTIGYGDIYPITTLGKVLGTIISFLGVGMVAIPTGIISAGFVEQYSRVQESFNRVREAELQFIRVTLDRRDEWVGRSVRALDLPGGILLAAIQRGHDTLIPRGDTVLEQGDALILAAEHVGGEAPIALREVTLLEENPWVGQYIRDLDISRQTLIVMVRRGGQVLIPQGDTRLKRGDTLLLHTKVKSKTE